MLAKRESESQSNYPPFSLFYERQTPAMSLPNTYFSALFFRSISDICLTLENISSISEKKSDKIRNFPVLRDKGTKI